MRSRFLSSKDFGGACGRSLGVKRTPEVVVIDSEKHLRYRGRIDDQYRLGGVRKEGDEPRFERCPRCGACRQEGRKRRDGSRWLPDHVREGTQAA